MYNFYNNQNVTCIITWVKAIKSCEDIEINP